MIGRSSNYVGLALACGLIAACDAPVVAPEVPVITIVRREIWRAEPLILASSAFAPASRIEVRIDTAMVDSNMAWRISDDTIGISLGWNPIVRVGRRTVTVHIDGRPFPTDTFDVVGAHDWERVNAAFTTWPRTLAGNGFRILAGTSRGLEMLDVRYAAQVGLQLLDSTVDPSCLRAIGSSGAAGVVVAARGCGTLRARVYPGGAEIDSGPVAAGWLYANHYPPGTWLLTRNDTVALAVRGAGGVFSWTKWPRRARVGSVVPSADGRRVLIAGDPTRSPAQLQLIDLERGELVYQDSIKGTAATFTPSGDTVVLAQDSVVTLIASSSGQTLASFGIWEYWNAQLRRGVLGWPDLLVWDPSGPWLYGFLPYLCGHVIVDRRTWTVVDRDDNNGGGCFAPDYGFVGTDATTRWLLLEHPLDRSLLLRRYDIPHL